MIESKDINKTKSQSAEILEKGICRVCGCTWFTPCLNPLTDPCSWADHSETLCSDCVSDDD